MDNMWWGAFTLRPGELIEKQIGPLAFAIKKELNECQIYFNRIENWQEDRGEEYLNTAQVVCPENLKERYITNNDDDFLNLLPILADRPVVAQPVTPFYIPNKQKVTIFVTTPLWVRVSYDKDTVKMSDIAIHRPSDTWFGPNTMEGEFCYASQTSARLNAGNLPKRFHRATTPVQILNESDSHLLLERINLPVTYLEIYQDANSQLWTQAVKMIKEKNDETAKMVILPGPPQEAPASTLLNESREIVEENTIIRKISGFFG